MRILNVLVFASLMVSLPSAAQPPTEVVAWRDVPDRRWPGPNVWANRLEDWSVQDGVLRCNAGLNGQNWRTAHLLSHDLAAEGDAFRIEVDLDRSHKGQAGILFAAGEGMEDHRRASMVQSLPGLGGGFLIVWQFDRNRLAFLDYGSESDDVNPPALQGERSVRMLEGAVPGRATLVLTARSAGADTFTLKAQLMEGERVIAESMAKVPTARLAGNIALASRGSEDAAGHRFHAIRAGGERIATHHDRGFGPIAGVLYSVANGDLKVGVQCVSLGRTVNASGNNPPSRLSLRLERRSMDGTWTAVTPPTGVSEPDYYTLLRVRGHDTSNAHDFRVVMNGEGDTNAIYAFHVPAEPTGDVVVGGVSCTGVMGRIWGSHRDRLRPGERFSGRWTESNVWMPWEGVTDPLLQREPDIVFFTGDQLYESNPTPRDAKDSFPVEDYLYKWLIWHWSFQEVTRRVPVVLQTDDHDVWHPNLWGDGGRLMTSGGDPGGGYLKSIYFVNLVHRTMAGHNPDAYWPGPLDSGVLNYFTTFTYGGVDFAVLEDRKFKSARIDETRQALPPQLLGNTQLAMLEAWAEDPDASTARVVVSQTNYVNLATRRDTGELSKDRDSHGWPKPARDRAVELFERAGALLFTGDQHLASVSRLETETGPGVVQFCQPAGGCIWWRWFYPNTEAHHGTPGDPSYLGRFTDGFGNPFEVMAVANPAPEQELPRRFNPQRHAVNPTEWEAGVGTTKRIHQGEGFAILHLEPDRDRATLECWPYGADADAGPDGQFSDWPIELRLPASR